MEIRPWTLMYVLAAASVVVCFALLYVITVSRDAKIEWMVWTFLGIGVTLAVGGFWFENDEKRKLAEMSGSRG